MDTGNTVLYVCMTHGYWQYCTRLNVRVYIKGPSGCDNDDDRNSDRNL